MALKNYQKTYVGLLLCVVLAGQFTISNVQAKQDNFSKLPKGSFIEYAYSFTTPDGKNHKLKFKLDRNLTEQSKRLFTESGKRHLMEKARQESERLFEEIQATYIEQARDEFDRYINEQIRLLPAGINIQNQSKGKNIRARSDGSIPRAQAEALIDDFLERMNRKWQEINQKFLVKIEEQSAKQTQKYYIDIYRDNFYVATFDNIEDTNFSLRIDFDQVAKLHLNALKPIAREISKKTHGLTMREVINFAAYFIQSIPYDTLDSRDAHDEVGFVAPLTLFNINKGDCDTKSTALAAILRNIYPELDIKMVLIPNHAFLAIRLKGQDEDTAIIYHESEYVLVEAAGPALTPLGQSYESSLKHMQSNPDNIGRIISML